jgi:uncharacterized membrane protein YidH (DUF202 family)
LPENQYERTVLAWRRTLIGILAVLGIGGIHISVENHPLMGIVAGAAALFALFPTLSRTRQLRRHEPAPATWQPIALVVGLLALAASFVLLG